MKKAKPIITSSGVISFAFFLYLFSSYNAFVTKEVSLDVQHKITNKTTAHSLSQFFSDSRLISNPFERLYHKIYVKLHSPKILAGTYNIKGTQSVSSLFDIFSRGGNVFVSLTIPEGYRCEEIAALISQYFLIDSASFAKEVLNSSAKKKYGISGSGNLRGYLMPETYQFYPDATIEIIVKKLTSEFTKFYKENSSRNSTKHSQENIIKMASIIEKEAIVPKERRLIGGVFYHRLAIGMRLQTDPTVRFATNNFYSPILRSQLLFDSPYNTYRYKGLPPTAICNPGKASILAALNPEKTNMLYFMAKFDGTGEHYFAQSNRDHNNNVKKGRQNLRKR